MKKEKTSKEASEEVITGKGITFKYPMSERFALKDVDFHLKEGEVLIITGPSGAGKSTLCLTLNGIIPKLTGGDLEGEIKTLGKNPVETKVSELAKDVGIVLQDPEAQFVAGFVKNDIVYGLENLRYPRDEMIKRLEWALKVTRLEGLADRKSYLLSGGQKQRVSTAAGLVLHPEILILDEPDSELDPIGKTEIHSVIKDLNRNLGVTIVLVTHELERVLDWADRVIVMNDGRVVLEGRPREALSRLADIKDFGRLAAPPQVFQLGVMLKEKFPGEIADIPLGVDAAYDMIKRLFPRGFDNQESVKKKICEPPRKERLIIEAKDLTFTYPEPRVTALKNINVNMYEGEVVGVIGQNGSGKTTLVKHFNGLLKPTSGKVVVDGIDTKKTKPQILSRKVGYIFQNPNHQIFNETVYDEVAFGPRNLGFSEEKIEVRVKEALELLRLSHLAEENPLFLSKGEKGRLALASVAVMDPQVVVLDEPTTGQDWFSCLSMMKYSLDLNKRLGSTIIVVTHNMQLIAEYVNRVIVMGLGSILLDAPIREVFAHTEVLKETFIEPPQIVKLSQKLKDIGIPQDILSVEEMYKVILENRN